MICRFIKSVAGAFKCRPHRQLGRHGLVIHGLGGMGDAEICLRCGLEYYPVSFTSMRLNCEQYRKVESMQDWHAISEARKLPGGINSCE